MLKHVIWEYNYILFSIRKFNFNHFNWGGLCEKHAVTTWNFGNYLSSCWKREENLCQDGWSQDLPKTY